MHGRRVHAVLALLGVASVACGGEEEGARPTSSAGSVGSPDSGVFDPYESTSGGSSGNDTDADPSNGPSAGGPGNPNTMSGPDSAESGDDPSAGPGTGGTPTSGTAGESGSMPTGTSGMPPTTAGSSSTGYYGTTGYYATTGYYDPYGYALEDDDGWYTGLGAVECGDIPLRNCP